MVATLSDIANWAQILAVPIALLAWLVTGDRFAKFWKCWFRLIFGFVLLLALWAFLRFGWLSWLTKSISIPVWLAAVLFHLRIRIDLVCSIRDARLGFGDPTTPDV